MMKSSKGTFLGLVGIGLFFIAGVYYVFFMQKTYERKDVAPPQGVSCETKFESVDVKEDVMASVIKRGDKVQVEMGYYNCKEPIPGDIVLMQAAGKPDPIIRFVKVVPEDEFKIEQKQNKYVMKVNGRILENFDGEAYAFTEQKSRLLKLYEKSLKGKLKDGVYFVFSNKTSGGLDSTRFGPVERSKFIGKIVLPENR